MTKTKKSIIVLCCLCAVGALIVLLLRQSNQPSELPSQVAKPTAVSTLVTQKTPTKTPLKLELSSEIDELIDEEIEAIQRIPDLETYMQGWDRDAQYEIGVIAQETFSDTLKNMADWKQNYFRLVLANYTNFPCTGGSLELILASRRFSKLLEELRDDETGELVIALLKQLEKDIDKFEKMKREDPNSSDIHWSSNVDAGEEVTDKSDLPGVLAFRINASVLLIGQRKIAAGLPLVLKALDAADDTFCQNWTLASYAVDKIISEKQEVLTPAQVSIRDEYLAWKSSFPELTQDGSVNQHNFQYNKKVLPSWRSPRRPNERATAMGGTLPPPEKYGTVEVEFPNAHYMQVLFANHKPYPPQAEIVEFGRRFVQAGEG